MSEKIRFGGAGRYAAAFLVTTFMAIGWGQAPNATPAVGAQDAAKSVVPPAETPAVPAATASPQAPDNSKSSAKSSKNAKVGGKGQVTSIGVQEEPYLIGPEDVLGLNVLHQLDVSQTLEVRPDGYVSVRFAGEIRAAGLTTQQLSDAITEKLKTYFNNPEVNIQVLKINSKKYYMNGGVRKPGAYPLTSPITVYEALIEAGGLTDFAKKTKIYIQRGTDRLPFNYKEVSHNKNLQQNVLLKNGDVVTVPE
jgi:polysaccharide export outer membrane protein